jgi:hypothetical protein
MLHAIPPLQASAQDDSAPIAVSSKSPRPVSHQKLAHLAHLSEIKLDFRHSSHAQTCASCASKKITSGDWLRSGTPQGACPRSIPGDWLRSGTPQGACPRSIPGDWLRSGTPQGACPRSIERPPQLLELLELLEHLPFLRCHSPLFENSPT